MSVVALIYVVVALTVTTICAEQNDTDDHRLRNIEPNPVLHVYKIYYSNK